MKSGIRLRSKHYFILTLNFLYPLFSVRMLSINILVLGIRTRHTSV